MTATAVAVPPERLAHRPDIEGLRAVAVVLVLLFHAEVPGFAGGYVGVDVFFVLSGFLITRLLLDELRRTGTIRLREFYARRLRRLLPASSLVIVSTVVGAWFLAPPLLFAPIATDGLWAAGWLANYRFIGQGLDYLAAAGAESPLLHFWSLAVEEQFYLLWPALILIVAFGSVVQMRRRVGVLLTVVVAASLTVSIVQTVSEPVVAYYALHTRAWELGLGGLLAVAAPLTARVRPWAGTVLSALGLVVLVGTSVYYTTATPFPGWTALAPVLATGALLVGGQVADRRGVGRLLYLPPLQALGKWSYSLYLWHWPLLVMAEHAYGATLTVWHRLGLLAVTVLLSALSYRFVEDPIRRSSWLSARPRRSIAGGLSLAATVIAVLIVVPVAVPALAVGQGAAIVTDEVVAPEELPERLADAVAADLLPSSLDPPLDEARDVQPRLYDDGCFVDIDDVRTPDHCVYGPDDDEPLRTIALFGDSHAAHWFPPLHDLAVGREWRLAAFTKAGCPAMDLPVFRHGTPYRECDRWREDSIARIAELEPDMIVLSSARSYDPVGTLGNEIGGGREPFQEAGLRRTVKRLQQAVPDADLAVMGTTPQPAWDAPVCLSANLADIGNCSARVEQGLAVDLLAAQRRVAEQTGAIFVNPADWLCHEGVCPAVIATYLVYNDGSHLAPPLTRWLRPLVEEALLRESSLPAP